MAPTPIESEIIKNTSIVLNPPLNLKSERILSEKVNFGFVLHFKIFIAVCFITEQIRKVVSDRIFEFQEEELGLNIYFNIVTDILPREFSKASHLWYIF